MGLGPKYSIGLYVPNADFGWKWQSLGNAGLPDGWAPSTLATTDLITPARVHWVPALIGGGIASAGAYLHGSGRNLRVVAPSTLANNAARYLVSPAGPYSQLPGWEPSTQAFWGSESTTWWARIRLLFKGNATPPTTDWSLNLRQLNAIESSDSSVGSLTIPSSAWDGTWKSLESAPLAINLASGALDHVRVRLIVASGPGAGSSIGQFDHFVVETLGPVDFAEQTAGEGQTLAAADHETYYQLQKAPRHEGALPGNPVSLAKKSTLPNGSSRWYDPTGGAIKRRFAYSYDLMFQDDAERMLRLWHGNKGRGGSAGQVSYGIGRPLVLTAVHSYYQRSVYVDFDAEQFPLEPANTWESAAAATARWRGTFNFLEV